LANWFSASADSATYRALPIMSDFTEGPPLERRGLFEQFHDDRG